MNEVNQSINADQNKFARKEVQLAELNSRLPQERLFREKNGNLSVESEQAAVFIYLGLNPSLLS